ncbi:MAG: IspD/TarI family cytidylyltransferase [Opitutaceae bacterium]
MQDAAAILLAAGRGSRMGGAVDDKILATIGARPVFDFSLAAFVHAGIVGRFIVVYRDAAQRARLTTIYNRSAAREWPVRWVRGGTERQDSVAHALHALPAATKFVFIHDCARPLVRVNDLRRVDEAVRRDGAACLAHRLTDTVKRAPANAVDGVRKRFRTIDRSCLWGMETPQAFARDLIAGAYERVKARGLEITDDASAIEAATRHALTLVESSFPNLKITRPDDLAYAGFLAQRHRDDRP